MFQMSTSRLDNSHVNGWCGTYHKLPSKGQVLVWIDNDLRHIDPRQMHQISVLPRGLDHTVELQQRRNYQILLIVASPPSQADPLEYKPNCFVYQAHLAHPVV